MFLTDNLFEFMHQRRSGQLGDHGTRLRTARLSVAIISVSSDIIIFLWLPSSTGACPDQSEATVITVLHSEPQESSNLTRTWQVLQDTCVLDWSSQQQLGQLNDLIRKSFSSGSSGEHNISRSRDAFLCRIPFLQFEGCR